MVANCVCSHATSYKFALCLSTSAAQTLKQEMVTSNLVHMVNSLEELHKLLGLQQKIASGVKLTALVMNMQHAAIWQGMRAHPIVLGYQVLHGESYVIGLETHCQYISLLLAIFIQSKSHQIF